MKFFTRPQIAHNVKKPLPSLSSTQPGMTKSIRFMSTKTMQSDSPKAQSVSRGQHIFKSPTSELDFSPEHYHKLNRNLYCRFQPNSGLVGHALLRFNGKETTASQYALPNSNQDTPRWTPIAGIMPIRRFGKTVYKAQTLDGTTVYSNRGYHFTDQNQHRYEFRPFYLPPSENSEPFWGSTELISITNNPSNANPSVVKCGREIVVDQDSVLFRKANRKRYPSQNQVMRGSALQAYQKFWKEYGHNLTPDMKAVFIRAMGADRTDPVMGKFALEWLHGEGRCLSPRKENAQRKSNLGSGPNWANTEMLIFETICLHYGLYFPEVSTIFKPTLYMLFETDIIQRIEFEIQLAFKTRRLQFNHRIEPLLQPYPVFPQSSDIAQLTGVSLAILSGTPALTEEKIPNTNQVEKSPSTDTITNYLQTYHHRSKNGQAQKVKSDIVATTKEPNTRKQSTLKNMGFYSIPIHSKQFTRHITSQPHFYTRKP